MPTTIDEIVDQVVARVGERYRDRMSELRHVNGVSVALRDIGSADIGELANKAATQLGSAGLRLVVIPEIGGNDHGTDQWWKNALIEAGQQGDYWVNFQEGQYWFQILMANAPVDFHFVVSLHHVGRQLSGVMRAAAFAEFDLASMNSGSGHRDRQERVRRQCSTSPFTVTWQMKSSDLEKTWTQWVEEAFAVGLRHWLDLFWSDTVNRTTSVETPSFGGTWSHGRQQQPPNTSVSTRTERTSVRLVAETAAERADRNGAVTHVARQLGIGPESVRQAEIDRGDRGGLTTAEQERIKVPERENRELRRANEILKSAAVFFGAELDRRSTR